MSLTLTSPIRIKTESSDVKDFTQKTAMDDLTIIIQHKKLYVSKYVLSLASPVFKKMFESNFKERSAKELELPGKSYEVFYQFLRAIYPCGPELTDEFAFDIFRLAEEYQIANLKKKCVYRFHMLLRDSPENHVVFKILQLAILYYIDDCIIDTCLTNIASYGLISRNHIYDIQRLEAEYDIPDAMKVRIRDKVIYRFVKY